MRLKCNSISSRSTLKPAQHEEVQFWRNGATYLQRAGGGSDMRPGRTEWLFHTVLIHLPTNSSCCGALDNLGRTTSSAFTAAEGDISGCVFSELDTLNA